MVGVCFWVPYMVLLCCTTLAIAKPKQKCVKSCKCLNTFIDCDSQSLDRIPSNIPTFAVTVEINRNNITAVEALTFQHLDKLQSLKLKHNHINTLKDGAFYGLKIIEKLVLDYNEISVINKGWLYGLVSLKKLSLSNNQISQIHTDAWEFCTELTILNLSFNKLEAVREDTFKHLGNLEKLYLNNNNIVLVYDESFSHLPRLKILMFNFNKISWTIEDSKGVFQQLGELNKISLAGNNIKSINPDAFLGLSNVTYINLDVNNITSIHNNTFTKVPSLKQLIINTKTMLCDCNLIWFLDWLDGRNMDVNATCAYPHWFNGMSINKVDKAILTCKDVIKPRLTKEPEAAIMALKGKSVILSCAARSSTDSQMKFIWKKDNIQLLNANIIDKTTKDPDGKSYETVSQLKLMSVENAHAGKYQCVASNAYGNTYSQQSTISVLVFPTFIKKPVNVEVETGETIRLECSATGEPQPEMGIKKDGGNDFPAATERRMHVLKDDDVFFITNAQLTDSGIYSCTAQNAAGTASAEAHVEVKVMQKPELVNQSENRELVAGEPIVLQCMAQGWPKPIITWFKDGEQIVTTERHFSIAENQIIIIVDSVHNDSGLYECHLNNSRGSTVGRSLVVIKPNLYDTSTMLGIIIITVVCCAVFTSIVWVGIIYHTRRSSSLQRFLTSNSKLPDPVVQLYATATELKEIHPDCGGSDKDSGTGDSARRSSDDLAELSILLHCPRTDHDRVRSVDDVENTPPPVE